MENIFIVLAQCYFWYFGAHNNKFPVRFDQKRMRTFAFIIHNNAFAHRHSETKCEPIHTLHLPMCLSLRVNVCE